MNYLAGVMNSENIKNTIVLFDLHDLPSTFPSVSHTLSFIIEHVTFERNMILLIIKYVINTFFRL